MLVLQGEHQGLPAGTRLADPPSVLEEHLAIERDVGAFAGDGVHGLGLDPVEAGGNQKRGEAAMPLTVGLGTGQHEDVVGDVTVGGEHLLAVDHPSPVNGTSPGLHGSNVGSRLGLAHAEGDQDLTPCHLGENLTAQPIGADRPDHVGDHQRRRRAVDRRFGSRELMFQHQGSLGSHRRAVLGRPSGCGPVSLGEPANELVVVGHSGLIQLFFEVLGEVLGQEGPDVRADCFGFVVPGEIHHRSPFVV